MFRVAICDDEIDIHTCMQDFFQRFSAQFNYTFELHFFHCGEDLLQHYHSCSTPPFHILILDIEMKGRTGIETARAIRCLPDREVQIAFLTSHEHYMMSSIEAQPTQYWCKPIDYDFFAKKMNKLCQHILSSDFYISKPRLKN